MGFRERFRHGYTSERGKRADLMFLQHMLAVVRHGGRVATVMPHGVLFRGGAEREIRKSILEDDLLEAVIGLAPNLFYGTGIPACILVLRANASHGRSGKPHERQGRVLFINADAEYHEGRAQNFLRPEHIEKIVATFRAFRDVERYARVVPIEELAENDYNLNIRRYADNAPPPEPHDVRAHLQGGVPRAEVAALRPLFDAVGLDAGVIFRSRIEPYTPPSPGDRPSVLHELGAAFGVQSGSGDPAVPVSHPAEAGATSQPPKVGVQPPLPGLTEQAPYVDFRPSVSSREGIKTLLTQDRGVQARRGQLAAAFAAWWQTAAPRLAALVPLPRSNRGEARGGGHEADLLGTRNGLMESFEAALRPIGMLDRFQVTGAVAAWWDGIDYDLRTLANQGFQGLIDSWVASIRAAVEDEGGSGGGRNNNDPLQHPLVERLLPGYLARLDALAAREAELKTQIAEGKRLQEDEEADEEEVPTDEALTEMRREQRDVRKQRRELQADFLARVDSAREELDDGQARDMVLAIERERLEAELERYVTAKQQALVAALETLWDKYHVSLRELEAERDAAAARLGGFVEELRYGGG